MRPSAVRPSAAGRTNCCQSGACVNLRLTCSGPRAAPRLVKTSLRDCLTGAGTTAWQTVRFPFANSERKPIASTAVM